jgi:hypothetical protein
MKLTIRQVIGYIIITLFTLGGISITVINFMEAGLFYLYTLLGMFALIGILFYGFWLIKPREDTEKEE